MSIRFKTFINALCESVAAASENLNNRGSQFVERFFEKKSERVSDGNDAKSVYTPKTVLLEAPVIKDDNSGEITNKEIDVPLMALTPQLSNKIEKLTLRVNLRLYVEDEEVMIDLNDPKLKDSDIGHGDLEITISPNENADGLEHLIDSYTNIIKNQIQ